MFNFTVVYYIEVAVSGLWVVEILQVISNLLMFGYNQF